MDRSPQGVAGNMTSPASVPFVGPMFTQHHVQFRGHDDYSPRRQFAAFGSIENRRQNATRIARGPHFNTANHHNHVDIERIRGGHDVRTTVSNHGAMMARGLAVDAEILRSCFGTFQTKSHKRI